MILPADPGYPNRPIHRHPEHGKNYVKYYFPDKTPKGLRKLNKGNRRRFTIIPKTIKGRYQND